MRNLFIITAIFMMGFQPVLAERNSGTADGATSAAGSTTTPEMTSGTPAATTEAPTTTSTVARPSGTGVVAPTVVNPGYRGNLDNSSSSQGKYAMVGTVVSTVLAVKAYSCFAACTATAGASCAGCVPWALASVGAAAVAMHNKSKSNQNADSAGQFIVDPGTTDSTSAEAEQRTSQIEYQNALKPLDKANMKYDLKKATVTTPDGKTYSQNDISSPSAMSAAGLNPADFGKLKDMMKKAEKDALALKGVDGGSGSDIAGGGGGGKTSSETAPVSTGLSFNPDEKLTLNRDPAQVAGLSKNLNGEPIGVSSDSIFGIIDRRYQLHKNKGSFLLPGQ